MKLCPFCCKTMKIQNFSYYDEDETYTCGCAGYVRYLELRSAVRSATDALEKAKVELEDFKRKSKKSEKIRDLENHIELIKSQYYDL